ncbi:hypothetical protein WA026_002109 [Henosepilachna vigintioctopunctata]|uniref:C2H2-type domain-containing protein n=1 Tax=Henosepilachna vigintioctopunctata TaxID=420089 RepID=A0AAW1TSK2_9CUCU
MRQFRMPIQHTKNLSKFKKQIGSILRELKEFDDKEKHEAFSYLQGCIFASRINKLRNSKRQRIQVKTPSVKKQTYKCRECKYASSTKNDIFHHIDQHNGFPLSCTKCRITFNNNLSFDWHLKFRCGVKSRRKSEIYSCSECPKKLFSKQNLKRHLDGHKRNNCTYCDQVITNRKHLIQHLLDVHSIKLERAIHKCGECDKRYVEKRSLYYHKQQHFTDKYVCSECGTVCDMYEEMKEHYQKHEQQKNFKCSRCNQKFTRRQQYLIHIKRHNNYKCTTCNETFASKMKMMVHKQKGHDVEGLAPKFSCPKCEREFFHRSKLIIHLRKHTDDKHSLSCQYCDKSFQSPYNYYKHCITVAHEKCSPEVSVYICESCGGQFRKKYLLQQHKVRMHKNHKEYITCEFCSYKTKHRANMNRHRETHITNGKIYICEQCGKDFTNLASLKSHISYLHIQSKIFNCNKCAKTFKRNSELVRHQETHSDDRPHVCNICGQSYKRSTHLRRHEQSSHKLLPPLPGKQKIRVNTDGTFVPVQQTKKDKQVMTSSIDSEPTLLPVIAFVESEPLALVKRKDYLEYSDRILITDPQTDISYFDNINTNNPNIEFHSLNEEDIILDMSLMSNNVETQYFLNSQFTNDQFIQEYIGEDNLQFAEGQSTSYTNTAPASNHDNLNNEFD